MPINNTLRNFNTRTNYMFGHKYLVTITDTDYLTDKEKDKKYKTHVMGHVYGDYYQFSELSRDGVEDKTRILELINCISVKIPEIKKDKKEWRYGNGGTFMMIPKYDKSNLELTFYETLDGTVMNLVTKYFRDQYGYNKDPSVAEYYKTNIPEPATRKPIKEIKVHVFDNVGSNIIKTYIFKDCHIDSYNHYNMTYTSNTYVNINLSISYEYFEIENYGRGLDMSKISRSRLRKGMIDRSNVKGLESEHTFKTDSTKQAQSNMPLIVNTLKGFRQKRQENREQANKTYEDKTRDPNLHANDNYKYNTTPIATLNDNGKTMNDTFRDLANGKFTKSKEWELRDSFDGWLTFKLPGGAENREAVNTQLWKSAEKAVNDVIYNGNVEGSEEADRRLLAATNNGEKRYIDTGKEDYEGKKIQVEIDQQKVEDAQIRETMRMMMGAYGKTDDVNVGYELEKTYNTALAIIDKMEEKKSNGEELTEEENRALHIAETELSVLNGENDNGSFGEEQIEELHKSDKYKDVSVYRGMEDLGVADFYDAKNGNGGNKTDSELDAMIKGYFKANGVKNPTKEQMDTARDHYRSTRARGQRNEYNDGQEMVNIWNNSVTEAHY